MRDLLKTKKEVIKIEKKWEKNGFVIIELPTETKNELNWSIDKIFPVVEEADVTEEE